jgi:RNA polymerase primary sigma factor
MAMRPIVITQATSRKDSLAFEKYLSDISKYNVLTPEEEFEAASRAAKGDQESIETLVKANLRFVISVAKKYQNMGLPLEDLVAHGNMGLLEAAKRFDPSRGFKFISYAVFWIREAILKALMSNKMIHVPGNVHALYLKIRAIKENYVKKYGQEPSIDYIYEKLSMKYSKKKIEEAISCFENQVEWSDVQNILSEEDDSVDKLGTKNIVQDLLSTLNSMEREVIEMRFGIGRKFAMSYEEISKELGIGVNKVQNIYSKAMKKLREVGQSKNLRL